MLDNLSLSDATIHHAHEQVNDLKGQFTECSHDLVGILLDAHTMLCYAYYEYSTIYWRRMHI